MKGFKEFHVISEKQTSNTRGSLLNPKYLSCTDPTTRVTHKVGCIYELIAVAQRINVFILHTEVKFADCG
jgi:hypothetical protein